MFLGWEKGTSGERKIGNGREGGKLMEQDAKVKSWMGSKVQVKTLALDKRRVPSLQENEKRCSGVHTPICK